MRTAEAQQGQQAAAAETSEVSLLDQILDNTKAQDEVERNRNRSYIEQFIAQAVKPDQVVSKEVEENIKYWISAIDQKLSAQLNEVMHHESFQKLEATWRGLHYLVNNTETGETLKIRVLNTTKKDLLKDLEKAVEFDQSALFKKAY